MQILDDCMERVYAEAQQQWQAEAERSRQAAERERRAAEQRRAAKAAKAEANRAAAAAAEKQCREAAQAEAQKAAAAAVQGRDPAHQKHHPGDINPGARRSADVPGASEQTAASAAATAAHSVPSVAVGSKRRPDESRTSSASKRQSIHGPASAALQDNPRQGQKDAQNARQNDLGATTHLGGTTQSQPGSATKRKRSEEGHPDTKAPMPRKQPRRTLLIDEDDEDEECMVDEPGQSRETPLDTNPAEGPQAMQPSRTQHGSDADAMHAQQPEVPGQSRRDPQHSPKDVSERAAASEQQKSGSQDASGQAALNEDADGLQQNDGRAGAAEEDAGWEGPRVQRGKSGRRGRGRGRARGQSSGEFRGLACCRACMLIWAISGDLSSPELCHEQDGHTHDAMHVWPKPQV